MQRARGKGHRAIRIEHDDVRVRSGRNRPLAGKQAEYLCRGGRGELDEAVERDAPSANPAVVDEAHPRFDAGSAVWDFREVVPAKLFLLFHTERTMIGRDCLQIVQPQAAPELILLRPLAQRRTHHVLRAFESRLLVVVVREEQILRAGFGVCGEPAVPRFGDHLQRLGRR